MFTLFSTESAPSHTKATCRKANGPRVFRIVSDGSQLPDGDLVLCHFPTSYMAVHKEVNPKSRGRLDDNSQNILVTHGAISVQCLPQNGRIEPERYVSTRLLHLAQHFFGPSSHSHTPSFTNTDRPSTVVHRATRPEVSSHLPHYIPRVKIGAAPLLSEN